MSQKVSLKIGSIHFTFNHSSFFFIEENDPNYCFFWENQCDHISHLEIPINIHLSEGQLSPEWKKIYDNEQSWQMYQNNDFYRFVLKSVHYDHPFAMATFNPYNPKAIDINVSSIFQQKKGGKTVVSNPLCYPLDQILIMYLLSMADGFIIHAAGSCLEDKLLLFPGHSGAGKSTLSRRFINNPAFLTLSDDRIIIRKIDDVFYGFGTPWPGEAGIAVNDCRLLEALLFIHHGNFNKIIPITPQQAMEKMFHVISIPWYDKSIMEKILSVCESLIETIPAYDFYFTPDLQVVDFLKNWKI